VTEWPSEQWPTDQLYPVVVVMKFCIVVVCTPKVYHQVTKWQFDQVTKWPSGQVTKWPVKNLMTNITEATILNGKIKWEDVLLPWIPMIPTDMSFEFKRLQFTVRLAFAMTINKAQRHRYKSVD
jgi:hypothetical protein